MIVLKGMCRLVMGCRCALLPWRHGDALARLCVFILAFSGPLFEGGAAYGQTAGNRPSLNGLNPALLSGQGSLGTNDLQLPGPETDIIVDESTLGEQDDSTPNGRAFEDDAQASGVAGRVGAARLRTPTAGSVRVLPEVFEVSEQQNRQRVLTSQGSGLQTSSATPFDPLGVRVGQFIFRPSIEVDTGYTSNSTNDVTGSGSTFVSINPQLAVESDFSRHAIGIRLQGGLDRFASGDDTSDLEVIVNGTGRIDVDNDTSVTGAVDFVAQEDDLTGVADDPLETTTTLSVQLDHALKQIDTRSQVRFSRNVNGSFIDAGGIEQDQDDLNSSLIGANFRTTLRTGASLQPFIEADVSREIFDESTDDLGNRRNVTGLRGLVGVEIDRGEKLSGAFAFGYAENLVDGNGIEDFGAFVAEFNLDWSPRRLTNVSLTGTTTLDAFPSIATPGDITYDIDLNVSRNIRENLTATAGSGLIFQVDGGDLGTDTTIEARLGLEYQLTRNFGITLGYDFARQFTADGAADFTSNTISLGLRAER